MLRCATRSARDRRAPHVGGGPQGRRERVKIQFRRPQQGCHRGSGGHGLHAQPRCGGRDRADHSPSLVKNSAALRSGLVIFWKLSRQRRSRCADGRLAFRAFEKLFTSNDAGTSMAMSVAKAVKQPHTNGFEEDASAFLSQDASIGSSTDAQNCRKCGSGGHNRRQDRRWQWCCRPRRLRSQNAAQATWRRSLLLLVPVDGIRRLRRRGRRVSFATKFLTNWVQ